MEATRRKAMPAQIRADRSDLDIADAMVVPFRPSSFVVDDNDPLDDSLEDIWPGLAAEVAARRAAGTAPMILAPAAAPAKKEPKPRVVKAKPAREAKARTPRKRTAKAPAAPSAPAPTPSVPAAARPVVTRAPLGIRRQDAAPLPSAAKRHVEGSQIPAEITGVVKITGSFTASTGETLVVEIEGVNNIARGLVVWSGPLQDRVRRAAASGQAARFAIRQPSNPRFKPAICDVMAN